MPKELSNRIQILNKQRRYKVDCASTAVFCSAALRETGNAERSISVTFVNENEIRRVNSRYRQRDCPTDVLSFVYNETMQDGSKFLGEILVAPHVAVRNAVRYRSHPENEIRKLLVHGILHLHGYDHEKDNGTMNRMQRKLTGRVFFKRGKSILKNRTNP